MVVADATRHHLVRREEHARVLDAADREHVSARLDGETVAAEGGDVQALDRLAVRGGANAGDVGVEVQAYVRRFHDGIAIAHAEAGRRAELHQSGAYVLAPERQG